MFLCWVGYCDADECVSECVTCTAVKGRVLQKEGSVWKRHQRMLLSPASFQRRTQTIRQQQSVVLTPVKPSDPFTFQDRARVPRTPEQQNLLLFLIAGSTQGALGPGQRGIRWTKRSLVGGNNRGRRKRSKQRAQSVSSHDTRSESPKTSGGNTRGWTAGHHRDVPARDITVGVRGGLEPSALLPSGRMGSFWLLCPPTVTAGHLSSNAHLTRCQPRPLIGRSR